MPKWFRCNGGHEATTVRISLNLSRDDYETLRHLAKKIDLTLREYIRERASDGIYGAIERHYEEKNEEDTHG